MTEIGAVDTEKHLEMKKLQEKIKVLEDHIAILEKKETKELKVDLGNKKGKLEEANGKVAKLEVDLEAANFKVAKLEVDLKAADAKVAKLEVDLERSIELIDSVRLIAKGVPDAEMEMEMKKRKTRACKSREE